MSEYDRHVAQLLRAAITLVESGQNDEHLRAMHVAPLYKALGRFVSEEEVGDVGRAFLEHAYLESSVARSGSESLLAALEILSYWGSPPRYRRAARLWATWESLVWHGFGSPELTEHLKLLPYDIKREEATKYQARIDLLKEESERITQGRYIPPEGAPRGDEPWWDNRRKMLEFARTGRLPKDHEVSTLLWEVEKAHARMKAGKAV
ncbi:MAG: hypothetical protein HS116_05260 [Planctomycetes bacterium]|nr:hypothetical protein [Planctomycetota bacterium]